MNEKILGIIPARGGSKSIPRKNIKSFVGKPLIEWTIEVGIKSEIMDRIIVSTDDKEIAEISKKAGAEVPFLRPAELSEDSTPTMPVLQHAILFLKEQGYYPDYILLMEPTSPCRQPFHLQEAVNLIKETGADSVVALGEVPKHYHPAWQFNITENKKVEMFIGGNIKNIISRRQNLSTTYFRNGVFYLFKTDLLFGSEPNMYGEDVRGYVIEEKYSTDIDGPEDWDYAEEKFKSTVSN